MTGENEHENERESAGDPTPPDTSMPEFEAEPGELVVPESADEAPRPRRFGAWGAARREETGPSLWHRASQKIKGLFSRANKDDEPGMEFADPESNSDDLPYLVAPEEHVDAEAPAETVWPSDEAAAELPAESVAEAHSIPAVPEVEEAPAAPEPKEDLKFLWNATEGPSADVPVEAAADDPTFSEDHGDAQLESLTEDPTGDMDAAAEPAEEAPRAKRPSFFKRLFTFGSKAADEEVPDTNETEIPDSVEAAHDVESTVPAHDEVVHEEAPHSEWSPPPEPAPEPEAPSEPESVEGASLDEALPMDAEPALAAGDELLVEPATGGFYDEPEVVEPDAGLPKKPGFFARLFGRKTTEAPPPVAFEPELEVAPEPDAAGQLDAVDQGFEAARSEFAPPEHASNQSFESVEDALPFESTMDMRPAVTPSSFAPPEPVEPAAPPAAAATGDEHMFFGGNTFDFESPKDERSTVEVTPPSDDRKTAEVSAVPDLAAHADEVERKTDEFEMIELDGATLQEPAVSPLAGKTAEVPKVGLLKKLFSRTKEVTQIESAVAPPPSANPTFLVQKFRTFYNEVVVYKNQKTEFTAGFATAIVTDYTADLSPEQAAQSLAVRLQQMLELQLAESSWMGGEIQELYPDAQYAMACLADEMLTNLEWPGQSAWGKHRLELTVFKTVASDLEVFKRIDKLLKNGPRTVGTRDLARAYLLVVASGFLGKYRPFHLPRALAEYRRRLYEFVYGGDALLLYAGERRIFPEAVSATVAGRGVKRISMAQQWAAILVLLLIGYTVISHLTWTRVSADLKDMTGRVEQARTATTAAPNQNGGGR